MSSERWGEAGWGESLLARLKGHSMTESQAATCIQAYWWRYLALSRYQEQRGAAIIKARGASSAASAASAAVDHMRSWALGSNGGWVSMGVASDGSYGVAEGIVYSYPCVCENGDYSVVQGLEINAFSQARMDATEQELREERAAVEELLG